MIDDESTALRAYRLWEEQGRPAGHELDFWLEAEAAEARQARARLASQDGADADRAPTAAPAHFVVMLDHAHLRIYQLKKGNGPARAQFELVEFFDVPRESQAYANREPAGTAEADQLPAPSRPEHHAVGELASHIERFLEERNDSTWDFAAGPALHEEVLGLLTPGVRSRLEMAFMRDLVQQSPNQLEEYFIS